MPTYRVYCFSEQGHVHRPPRLIDCPNDDAAMALVRQWQEECALEVWDDARRVGRIEPQRYEPVATSRANKK